MIEQRAGALADRPLVQRLLVAEARVEGRFGGAGARRDLLHARGAESVGGELGSGGVEDGGVAVDVAGAASATAAYLGLGYFTDKESL